MLNSFIFSHYSKHKNWHRDIYIQRIRNLRSSTTVIHDFESDTGHLPLTLRAVCVTVRVCVRSADSDRSERVSLQKNFPGSKLATPNSQVHILLYVHTPTLRQIYYRPPTHKEHTGPQHPFWGRLLKTRAMKTEGLRWRTGNGYKIIAYLHMTCTKTVIKLDL